MAKAVRGVDDEADEEPYPESYERHPRKARDERRRSREADEADEPNGRDAEGTPGFRTRHAEDEDAERREEEKGEDHGVK